MIICLLVLLLDLIHKRNTSRCVMTSNRWRLHYILIFHPWHRWPKEHHCRPPAAFLLLLEGEGTSPTPPRHSLPPHRHPPPSLQDPRRPRHPKVARLDGVSKNNISRSVRYVEVPLLYYILKELWSSISKLMRWFYLHFSTFRYNS